MSNRIVRATLIACLTLGWPNAQPARSETSESKFAGGASAGGWAGVPAAAPDTKQSEREGVGRLPEATPRFLTPSEIEAAIRDVLGASETRTEVTILDFSRSPVKGRVVELRESGASPPPSSRPDQPFLWRGVVRNGSGLAEPFWARVQVIAHRPIVRSRVTLPAGKVLEEADLQVGDGIVCPLVVSADQRISQYVGLEIKRTIPGLTPLNEGLVEVPPLIVRGSIVHVDALAGGARISFDGEAHADGRLGERIQVTNLHTGRTFMGLVAAKGKIRVEIGETNGN